MVIFLTIERSNNGRELEPIREERSGRRAKPRLGVQTHSTSDNQPHSQTKSPTLQTKHATRS